MNLIRNAFWFALFLVATFFWVVLFEHGPSGFKDGINVEMDTVKQLFDGKPLKGKGDQSDQIGR